MNIFPCCSHRLYLLLLLSEHRQGEYSVDLKIRVFAFSCVHFMYVHNVYLQYWAGEVIRVWMRCTDQPCVRRAAAKRLQPRAAARLMVTIKPWRYVFFQFFRPAAAAGRHNTPTCDSSSVAGRLIVDQWLPPVEQNEVKKNLTFGAKVMKNIGSFRSAAAEGRKKMGKK